MKRLALLLLLACDPIDPLFQPPIVLPDAGAAQACTPVGDPCTLETLCCSGPAYGGKGFCTADTMKCAVVPPEPSCPPFQSCR